MVKTRPVNPAAGGRDTITIWLDELDRRRDWLQQQRESCEDQLDQIQVELERLKRLQDRRAQERNKSLK